MKVFATLHTTPKREPILPITLELLLPLSIIDLTPSPPSISCRHRRNELRSHCCYRAALFHHRAVTISALKASSRSSVPSSPGSPPFSVEQLCSIVAGAISVPPVIPSVVPFNGGKGLSSGVIGGISVGIVAALLLLVFCVYVKCYRRKKIWNKKLVAKDSSENFVHQALDDTSIMGVKVEKSAEFSYEELANATNNFSLAKKIGQGGFGEVYYGELNGEDSLICKYVYGSVSPKIDVYAFRVVLYELISAKEALIRSGGASGAELKGLVALVIINDFVMELLQIEKQRKDEARKEALRVANEERKKLKVEAAQIRAQERKIAQQEFRETLLKERAEKLENWRMKVKKHGEKMAEKKELLRRQSSKWIDEANLEAQILESIVSFR
ncbi:uncharacterized protein DS421_2g47700 [Arachis hypogaea]|nr:uncharacterized protein DS421_2g47700 [Arachis hypogaea]